MEIQIKERKIGPGHPVFIIAEISGNHNQSYERALQIIDEAAKAGADAIKLQTYTPDTITIDCDNDYFKVKIDNNWKEKTLYELYGKAYTPWDWQPKLKKYVEEKGLLFFSSPFDTTAVDFLEEMGVDFYKVASFEVVDIPLLKRIGKTKKPVIMSRGMSTEGELELAIKVLREHGTPQIAILHCVSSYPAKVEEMNLRSIPDIINKFGVVAGLSDHSLSNIPSIAAVTIGASIIEKHLTLKRADGGPDSEFSLEVAEFRNLVSDIRGTEASLGKPVYNVVEGETAVSIYRKSLFVVTDMSIGEIFTPKNVRSIRPGHGLPPKYYDDIMGKKALVNIKRGTPLTWEIVSK